MRVTLLLLPLALATGSAIAFAQTVPGTAAPQDPVGYKSPYGAKTTPMEVCARDYGHVLTQTQGKMQRLIGITSQCAMIEALQDVSNDYANFNRRCPDFPAAKQAEAIHLANIKALRAECTYTLGTQPPLPTPIIDPRRQEKPGIQGCMLSEDGRPMTRDQQVECIRKTRQQGQ